MNILEAFRKFDLTFSGKFNIDREWYKNNCGVFSMNTTASSIGNDGKNSEEYYRARMVWSIVKSTLYPKENICVEFTIPKGSEGAKSLKPDIVIFKDSTWKSIFDSWDKTSALPEELGKQMLVVWEVKNDHKHIENAVTKQLSSAMNYHIGDKFLVFILMI